MDYKELVRMAKEAKKNAYAPYSLFKVGSAVLCKNGEVYTGCNIESASFTPTTCGERTALCKAVSEGKLNFSAIALISDSKDYICPCGVCRQLMTEFLSPSTDMVCANNNEDYVVHKFSEIMPFAFNKTNIKK